MTNPALKIAPQSQHILERIKTAPILQEPFPHILIQGLIPEKEYEELLDDIPGTETFSKAIYPGVGADLQTENGIKHGLILDETSKYPLLEALTVFLKSREIAQLLLERFAAPDSWKGHGSAIPIEKHSHFSNGSEDYTSVLDVHKDPPGYAISPHRDVDSKIITFLYYLEPDDALANWGTLLCRPKTGLSLDDVEYSTPLKGHPKWRSWSLFEVVKTARATPNTLLIFAPNRASYHAVNMDIPVDFVRSQRTVIRGFIRSGRNKNNFISSIGNKSPKQNILAGTRQKIERIKRKVAFTLEKRAIIRKQYDVIVVSYGGSGTTMLLDFLAPHMRVNSSNSFVDGIKHINSPDHPVLRYKKIERAIYLVADPREATLSLFRRNYALRMIAKLKAKHSNTEEYRRFVETYQPNILNLSDFLQRGEDLFGFRKHWQQWHEDTASFPVLFVRYDALHDSIAEILEFLGLPARLKDDFPSRRQRATRLNELTIEDRRRLDRIYEDMATEIAEAPNLMRRSVSD